MPHQHLILKTKINVTIFKKEKTELKSKKYMNLNLCSSSTKILNNTNPDLKIRTHAQIF